MSYGIEGEKLEQEDSEREPHPCNPPKDGPPRAFGIEGRPPGPEVCGSTPRRSASCKRWSDVRCRQSSLLYSGQATKVLDFGRYVSQVSVWWDWLKISL